MAKAPKSSVAFLTANDLQSGRSVFWTGNAWSHDSGQAARVRSTEERDALTRIGEREEAANQVVGVYLVDLPDESSTSPLLLRERQRLAGPSFPLPGS